MASAGSVTTARAFRSETTSSQTGSGSVSAATRTGRSPSSVSAKFSTCAGRSRQYGGVSLQPPEMSKRTGSATSSACGGRPRTGSGSAYFTARATSCCTAWKASSAARRACAGSPPAASRSDCIWSRRLALAARPGPWAPCSR